MAKNILTHSLSQPLNGAQTARIDIYTGSGNLTIDKLNSGEPLLASGTLEYAEKQGIPDCQATTRDGQTAFSVTSASAKYTGFRLPWAACNGATTWQIHLNPAVPANISAKSGGGNVKLDLAGMAVTGLLADTGGGNMEVVLPDNAADLNVLAKSGGGNVTVEIGSGLSGSSAITATSGAGNVAVRVPAGLAARLTLSSGAGKVIVDPCFSQVDKKTYQSPDYDSAADKVEITAKSGAGNVTVLAK